MRGPLLSGALGSRATLDALAVWVKGLERVVVLGPAWLAEALAAEVPVVGLLEPEARSGGRRVARRAAREGLPLLLAVGGAELPLTPGSVPGFVLEDTAGLDRASALAWVAGLVPYLRPGGRIIAVDATSSPAAMARVAGVFLGAPLLELTQERPREGVVLTVGIAPSPAIVSARGAEGGAPSS